MATDEHIYLLYAVGNVGSQDQDEVLEDNHPKMALGRALGTILPCGEAILLTAATSVVKKENVAGRFGKLFLQSSQHHSLRGC